MNSLLPYLYDVHDFGHTIIDDSKPFVISFNKKTNEFDVLLKVHVRFTSLFAPNGQ